MARFVKLALSCMLVASLYVLWNWASEANDYIDRCADDLNLSGRATAIGGVWECR